MTDSGGAGSGAGWLGSFCTLKQKVIQFLLLVLVLLFRFKSTALGPSVSGAVPYAAENIEGLRTGQSWCPLIERYTLRLFINAIRTSPFRKQYSRAIKNPWNDVRKCVTYDQRANSSAVLSNGASVMLSKFVIPNNGTRTTAARTAFRTCSTSLVWLWRSLTINTLIIFSKNMKFNRTTANLGPSRIQ